VEGAVAASVESDQPIVHALTPREIAVLDFEREWTRHAGAKEEAIREVFGLSAARYYQVLNAVIDSPHAVRHDPMLIKRLQRARDARVHTRAARTLTSSRQVGTALHPLPDETTD
jgi:hypothetical protein